MTLSSPSHAWAVTTMGTSAETGLPSAPQPHVVVRCHRRLRGPYTGGGALVRAVVPEMLERGIDISTARATAITALAPDLAPTIPTAPQTLTDMAHNTERTRYYPAARTQRFAHGICEVVADWARLAHPGGVVVAFRELDDADATDVELVCTLLRRCDPGAMTLLVEVGSVPEGPLGEALDRYARRVEPAPHTESSPPAGADLAQLFIDSDGTSKDPAVLAAYHALDADERARRHTARADALVALGEPALLVGAVPFHREHGLDRAGAGARAFIDAVTTCFADGFYQATLDLAERGRQLFGDERPPGYFNLTHKIGACLSYMRGEDAPPYFDEIRAGTIDPEMHMHNCYMMAMLYTRHLPKELHDHDLALRWVNTAIAIADRRPDTHNRVFGGAFMRNARALVELHRGSPEGAMALVDEAIAMTDAILKPDEHLLHRSVLLYNRAQIYAMAGNHAPSLLDYSEVIRRDPEYGEYYFERATVHRAAGLIDEALADYETAIRLSLPFHEAHYNRADLLRERGDDEGALRDLDYALDLEPTHLDSLVNRADLLLAFGEIDRARTDIEQGLSLDPKNANLLSAQGSVLEEAGDTEGALASYSAALAADPSFVAAWANRAVLLYAGGQVAPAIDDLDHAIALEDDPALRVNRAVALQDLGEHGRAMADLDIAVAAFGEDNPDLLYRRGASRYALDDVDGALADWRAHLAAYGPDEASPYVAQIQLRGGGLLAEVKISESVT